MTRGANRSLLFGVILALAALAGCTRHQHAGPDLAASAEPDKVLFEKSVEDIKNKRYDVARLTLQTLMNTYPDSDYLAAAKLAIADSYYEEGTTAALTHAEVEYKDYITFFPNTAEVSYAQYRAAMCHYRQLEKPDRDRTHAFRAEEEFQLLLRRYRDSQYADDGEKKLLQVQELLGESEYRVGRFYYLRESWRASAARLANLVERYPNYSQRDASLWMLGQIFQKNILPYWPGDPERAAAYYARLVREHPLSPYAQDAKTELANLGKPVPEPDPVLLARAQSVELVPVEEEERPGLLGRLFGMLNDRPDTSAAAARLGPPPLEHLEEVDALPAVVFRQDQQKSSVAVETVENAPAGTVIQTGGNGSTPGAAPADPNAKKDDKGNTPEPEKKKKSFWRRLIPFA